MVKKILFSFAFFLILCLVAGEIAVRILQDKTRPPSKVRQKDLLTHHSLVPNTTDIARTPEWESEYKINSLGMRDQEYNAEKPENTFRIMMVGDSYIEGQGVSAEQTASSLLEESLNKQNLGKKIEVLNTGILSYSPLLQYQMLRHRGVALKPDLVILNFDQGDVVDDIWYEEELTRDENGLPLKFNFPTPEQIEKEKQAPKRLPFVPGFLKEFLHNNFKLYVVIADSFKVGRLKLYPEIGETKIIPYNLGADKLLITRERGAEFDGIWAKTKANLDLIAKLLEENNIPLVITMYPYGHQVATNEWTEGRKAWFFEPKVYDNLHPFEIIQEFAASKQVPFHSMLSDFRAKSKGDLYMKVDGHWTPKGHEVAADSIGNFLLKNELIK